MEVVGVVLGAIPILIELADRLKGGVSRIAIFRDYRREIRLLGEELRYFEMGFKSILRRLLYSVFDDKNEIEALIKDSKNPFWDPENAEAREHLEARLDYLYQPFVETLSRYLEHISALGEEIEWVVTVTEEYEKDHYPQWNLPKFADEHARQSWIFRVLCRPPGSLLARARFASGRRRREQLVGNLRKCSDRLGSLLDDNERELVRWQYIQRSQEARPAIQPSSLTSDLFYCILASWGCPCWREHRIDLRLTKIENVVSQGDAVPNFDLVLASQTTSTAWVSRRASVRRAPHSSRTQEEEEEEEDAVVLRTLCKELSVPLGSAWKLAPLDHNNDFSIKLRGRVSSKGPPLDSFTLDELFHPRHTKPRARERVKLALQIALSFIWLIDTEWMPRDWCRADIQFYGDRNKFGTTGFSGPFFRKDFSVSPPCAASPQEMAKALRTLALVLIEVIIGDKFDATEWARLAHGPAPEMETAAEMHATWQKVDQVSHVIGSSHSTAIQECLNSGIVLVLDEKAWRWKFVDRIVTALRRSLEEMGMFDREQIRARFH